jgi:hypothetical protein
MIYKKKIKKLMMETRKKFTTLFTDAKFITIRVHQSIKVLRINYFDEHGKITMSQDHVSVLNEIKKNFGKFDATSSDEYTICLNRF